LRQTVFAAVALLGFVLFFYGSAVLLKLGILAPDLASGIEAGHWVWFALSVAFFVLLFYKRSGVGAWWVAPIAVLVLVGVGSVAGARWVPIQHRPAPVDSPAVSLARAGFNAEDLVLGLVIDGVAKAYPWPLVQHQVVINDTLNGQPVMVVYCISCNSGLAYRAQHEEQPLRFGTVGVYRYGTLLHDDQTGSWWKEDGESIVGKLKGARLEQLPAALLSWADWQTMYPETQVALK